MLSAIKERMPEKYDAYFEPFVGGGAVVMKNFESFNQNNFSFNTDICANAKGFETLAKITMSKEQINVQ